MSHLTQTPHIPTSCFIHPSADIMGDVTLGEQCSLWPQAVVRGDVNSIVIGEQTNIQDGCVLHVTHAGPYSPKGQALRIGNQVTIGHRAVLHGCQVADRCLLGIGSIVMDGAQIEEHTMLGASSLVPPNKRLEAGFLWVGQPVRKVRALTNDEVAFLSYSAEHYARLAEQYIRSGIA